MTTTPTTTPTTLEDIATATREWHAESDRPSSTVASRMATYGQMIATLVRFQAQHGR